MLTLKFIDLSIYLFSISSHSNPMTGWWIGLKQLKHLKTVQKRVYTNVCAKKIIIVTIAKEEGPW